MDATYRMRAPDVTSECIDGEVLVIDLRSGAYYAIGGLGADLWQALTDGTPRGVLIDAVTTAYPDDAAAPAATTSFIDGLVDEGLLVAEPPTTPAATPFVTPEGPFVAPVLEKYRDMEDVLKLDPIHEVDEGGWPRAVTP